jgi:hypothetical protein
MDHPHPFALSPSYMSAMPGRVIRFSSRAATVYQYQRRWRAGWTRTFPIFPTANRNSYKPTDPPPFPPVAAPRVFFPI